MHLYEIRPKRTGAGVELTGPVGSNGLLLFKCVRDAASHARSQAGMMNGGILKVYDATGRQTAERTMEGAETRSIDIPKPWSHFLLLLSLALAFPDAEAQGVKVQGDSETEKAVVTNQHTQAVWNITPLIDPAKLDALKGERAANRDLRLICYHLESARRAGDDPATVIADAQAALGMTGTARADAVKASLVRNLDILAKLGCLDPAGMAKLKTGNAPTVTNGPYAGDIASVDHIIPRSVCEELDEKLYNLEFMRKRPTEPLYPDFA